jgi:molecular chaperone GrpE
MADKKSRQGPEIFNDPVPVEPEIPVTKTPGVDELTEAAEGLPTNEAAEALAAAEDRFLRLAAEFDNYRRRTTKEKTESFDRGAAALVARLVDVLEDVTRLGNSDPELTTEESLRSAVQLIDKKFAKELELAGLERIDPVGQVFDPNEHEAVSAIAPEHPEQDHLVRSTFQAGYRFRGAVVRPAKVQVWSSTAGA